MHIATLTTCLACVTLCFAETVAAATTSDLWGHVAGRKDLGDLRNVDAEWSEAGSGHLRLTVQPDGSRYAWATILPPAAGWDLSHRVTIEADVANRGASPTEVQLWAVADRGWESVSDVATVDPGASRRFSCRLREAFADGTPKLDPARVTGVRVVLRNPPKDAAVDIAGLVATGTVPAWKRPAGRIELPPIEDCPPAAGRRVRYRPAEGAPPGTACLLHLPEDWKAGGRYPVIVEYPGNIFFVAGCYSTGLPEQCSIGYGITQGRGAIWLSMPFIDGRKAAAVEDGWGNPDDTADFCVAAVHEVCARFGGDPRNVVLTGFSRGAIACGFIGLRNDRIAPIWKGFHLCQHFDGDGWNGATLPGALDRARQFRGISVFHTDNAKETVQPITDAMGVPTTFARSGLGAHSTAMFLDDRESTRQLRRWFAELVGAGPPPEQGRRPAGG